MRKHEDSRPESYRPDQQNLQLGKIISAADGWKKENLGFINSQASMCEILALQREKVFRWECSSRRRL